MRTDPSITFLKLQMQTLLDLFAPGISCPGEEIRIEIRQDEPAETETVGKDKEFWVIERGQALKKIEAAEGTFILGLMAFMSIETTFALIVERTDQGTPLASCFIRVYKQ